MNKEFKLSDNGLTLKEINELLLEDYSEDVFFHNSKIKEFIRLLREVLKFHQRELDRVLPECWRWNIYEDIDNLTGFKEEDLK